MPFVYLQELAAAWDKTHGVVPNLGGSSPFKGTQLDRMDSIGTGLLWECNRRYQ